MAYNETRVTVCGNVASKVTRHEVGTGFSRVNFRLFTTERRWDQEQRGWADGSQMFLSVNCWRALADNAYNSLNRGDPVVVTGRMSIKELRDDGKIRQLVEIEATAIGPNLALCTARAVRMRATPGEALADQPTSAAPAAAVAVPAAALAAAPTPAVALAAAAAPAASAAGAPAAGPAPAAPTAAAQAGGAASAAPAGPAPADPAPTGRKRPAPTSRATSKKAPTTPEPATSSPAPTSSAPPTPPAAPTPPTPPAAPALVPDPPALVPDPPAAPPAPPSAPPPAPPADPSSADLPSAEIVAPRREGESALVRPDEAGRPKGVAEVLF
ncbi:single-stranded DNA-binding protein [Saccharothrix sp. BKS2]|uniref:single-stranded DNA-binding protein n=1 Tax=Saccharothrix sp. BKS2 TaxID=3064400 RepID=UPI0039E844DD